MVVRTDEAGLFQRYPGWPRPCRADQKLICAPIFANLGVISDSGASHVPPGTNAWLYVKTAAELSIEHIEA